MAAKFVVKLPFAAGDHHFNKAIFLAYPRLAAFFLYPITVVVLAVREVFFTCSKFGGKRPFNFAALDTGDGRLQRLCGAAQITSRPCSKRAHSCGKVPRPHQREVAPLLASLRHLAPFFYQAKAPEWINRINGSRYMDGKS